MKGNNYSYDRYDEKEDFSVSGNRNVGSKQSYSKNKGTKTTTHQSVYSSKHVRKTVKNLNLKDKKIK
jgi:hypothetical protein